MELRFGAVVGRRRRILPVDAIGTILDGPRFWAAPLRKAWVLTWPFSLAVWPIIPNIAFWGIGALLGIACRLKSVWDGREHDGMWRGPQ